MAASKVRGADKARGRVLAAISASTDGLTDEQIQQQLGMNPSTERPRRIELVDMGEIHDTGRTRETLSGRSAVVWGVKTMKVKKKVKRYKPKWTMIHAECLKAMADMPSDSVHCVVTSPPYWALRDYGEDEQHGSEPTIEEWLDVQVQVFREVKRILRPDGVCWVNIGDNFIDGDLQGQPWRLALALKADGWCLRMDCIWHKPNPLPEPGNRKRPTLAHEYVFMLTKSPSSYFFDREAVLEPQTGGAKAKGKKLTPPSENAGVGHNGFAKHTPIVDVGGRNRRSIWTFPVGGAGEEGHFAAFPEELPELCIKASTSEKGTCEVCGAQFERRMELTELGKKVLGKGWHDHKGDMQLGHRGETQLKNGNGLREFKGWRRTCKHKGFGIAPATVFDPYAGSGTTGMVALRLGRSFVGIELKEKWFQLAQKRLTNGMSQGGLITKKDLKVRDKLGLLSPIERLGFGVTE